MFLKPEQQLERCKRIVRQRVDPHIHPSIAQLAVESFDIPGEPMPTDEFFAKLNRGDIDFKPFTLGSEWGTTWGTVWFRLTGTVPAGYPKGKPLELILDLGWYPHSCGGHIEGLVYRADGTAIKAVHPLNYWVPFMDAEGNAQVSVAEDGSFTLYLEAASNPLLLGVPPFVETELGDHATGKPDEPYVFKSADLTEFDERYEHYSVDLDVVSSLMELADKQSPRYWQLAKALQRSLNAYDERNPESVEAARAALADVLAKPANASAMNVSAIGHAHIDSAWLWPVRETRRKVARTSRSNGRSCGFTENSEPARARSGPSTTSRIHAAPLGQGIRDSSSTQAADSHARAGTSQSGRGERNRRLEMEWTFQNERRRYSHESSGDTGQRLPLPDIGAMRDAGRSPLRLLLDDRASRDGACGSDRRRRARGPARQP